MQNWWKGCMTYMLPTFRILVPPNISVKVEGTKLKFCKRIQNKEY